LIPNAADIIAQEYLMTQCELIEKSRDERLEEKFFF